MKNVFKRALSLILVLSLLFGTVAMSASASAAVTAAAEPTQSQCHNGDCGNCPVIILPGINHSPTYVYDGNDNPVYDSEGKQVGGTLLIADVDKLKDEVLPKAILYAVLSLILQRDVKLSETVYKGVQTAFHYQKCDHNGNMINNLKVQRWDYGLDKMTQEEVDWVYRMVPMKSLVDEIGEDHTYFFTFNLIGNPMKAAEELDEYIDMVREQTGHDKVNLVPVSLGGTILTAYLDRHGHDKINAIVGAVACMDGTDIIADMMERKFKLDDEYLYHEFIPSIFKESEGYGTYGYLINIALRILPRDVVNSVLTSAMSGVLETMMIDCPQFWAMVPSARYDALVEKYINDYAHVMLRGYTDQFQEARLDLKDNILAAVNDGVKVNFISGSNLAFGEQEYSYFGIMQSSGKVNSDGIINLTSTTLDATGTVSDPFPAGYRQRYTNPLYPDYSYISPDRRIDASTALLPDNTWIFLNQHHEVGNNDVVLNLAKDLLLEKVTSVHSDPVNHPQFNYSCNTKEIRRWLLPDAKNVDQSKLSAQDAAELNAAIGDCEAVLSATIADSEKVVAAQERLRSILVKIGVREATKEDTVFPKIGEAITKYISLGLLKLLGGKGFSDLIKNLLSKIEL